MVPLPCTPVRERAAEAVVKLERFARSAQRAQMSKWEQAGSNGDAPVVTLTLGQEEGALDGSQIAAVSSNVPSFLEVEGLRYMKAERDRGRQPQFLSLPSKMYLQLWHPAAPPWPA